MLINESTLRQIVKEEYRKIMKESDKEKWPIYYTISKEQAKKYLDDLTLMTFITALKTFKDNPRDVLEFFAGHEAESKLKPASTGLSGLGLEPDMPGFEGAPGFPRNKEI